MPLTNVHLEVDRNNVWSPVYVYDGERFLLEVGDRHAHLDEDLERAHNEDIRIGQLVVDLLSNHGANDDTTGLYDTTDTSPSRGE